MIKTEQIDEIIDKITSGLPFNSKFDLHLGVDKVRQDIESNIRIILQSSFSKLDLVSREEFDIQSRLLERTREKVDQLSQRMDKLGKKI